MVQFMRPLGQTTLSLSSVWRSMATSVISDRALDYLSPKLYSGPSTFAELSGRPCTAQPVLGFPAQYNGARVWTGVEITANEEEWVTLLSDLDNDYITKALRKFQESGLEPQALSRETFPLPYELQTRLRALSRDCHSGRGFAVLRGLRTELFTEAENVLVFGGLSSHVAPVRGFQDLNRKVVTCHVVSEECRPGAEEHNLRPAFTNGRLAFHTDIGDLLSLFTIEPAENGGHTMLASSSKIYNDIAESRPDLLEELSKPGVYYTAQDYHTVSTPLITNVADDKLVFQYSRLPVTGFRNYAPNDTMPEPSAKRLEAMSLVEELAWKHAFPLPGRKGDIAYINNMTLMHARNAFDLDANGHPLPSKRHLVKLMLRDPELTWNLPESLLKISNIVYGPNLEDGGRAEVWQLTVKSEDTSTDHVWAGSGSMSNG